MFTFTMADLEALYEQYFPSEAPKQQGKPAQQGRAGANKTICPICEKLFVKVGHATRQKYCSRPCQQKAYRQRRQARAA